MVSHLKCKEQEFSRLPFSVPTSDNKSLCVINRINNSGNQFIVSGGHVGNVACLRCSSSCNLLHRLVNFRTEPISRLKNELLKKQNSFKVYFGILCLIYVEIFEKFAFYEFIWSLESDQRQTWGSESTESFYREKFL